ncbi:hypothetical protein M9Y10_010514 [Tritrichomonas musculus]|uniref:Uncharacterized protein n=1 Tax=Tritrichomonas musculus TaxID=1915356 RepID=A0ABR2ILU7_9EUKA
MIFVSLKKNNSSKQIFKETGNLNPFASKDVTIKSVKKSAKSILLKSKEGNAADLSIQLDPVYRNRMEHWSRVTTTYQEEDLLNICHLTEKRSKISIDYMQSVNMIINSYSSVLQPKQYYIISYGNIKFIAKNATVISLSVSRLLDGSFIFLFAYIDQHNCE